MNKIFLSGFLSLFFIFSLGLVSAQLIPDDAPCWVQGTVTGSGIDVDGLIIKAYQGSTLLLSDTIAGGVYDLNSIGANDGDTITLKVHGHVFDTFTFEGYCMTGDDPWIVQDFTVSKVADGQECNNDDICTSGDCTDGECVDDDTSSGSDDDPYVPPSTTTPTTTPEVVDETPEVVDVVESDKQVDEVDAAAREGAGDEDALDQNSGEASGSESGTSGSLDGSESATISGDDVSALDGSKEDKPFPVKTLTIILVLLAFVIAIGAVIYKLRKR